MSRGMPSLVALLGLLAVAGFQNRDKLAEMLGTSNSGATGSVQNGQGNGGVLGNLGQVLGGSSIGSILSGGLGDLVEKFRQNGQGQAVDSWVKTGPNQQLRPDQLEQAIGPETMKALVEQTGLSREELIARLTRELPRAIDNFTPDGRLPTADEASRLV
jgi:uncharacterized protein YidB (DUF937 family)